MNRLASLAVLCLVLLLAGCGSQPSAQDDGEGRDGRASDTRDDPPALPTGADDVVVSVETGGGYVPVEHAFAGVPRLLVLGSGLVVRPAPRPADAPQPAQVPLVQHTVDDRTLDDLGRLAADAGLLAEPPDYQADAPQVTDMPGTTVRITADGETWTHSAYALGFEEESGAREVLADFVDDALALVGEGTEPYRPDAVRLRATESAGASPEGPGAAWPEDAPPLATVGECTVVDEPAAVDAVTAALSAPATDGVFTDAGRTFYVAGAPVLPGESRPCADW